jgi:hypothetical protein
MHIILVHVVHSIQNSCFFSNIFYLLYSDQYISFVKNSCIKYSTQNQHFAEMFTYSDNTNYNLNFYYFIVSFNLFEISFIRQLLICVWCQWWNFRVLSTAPSFDETVGICAIVAVVDTRRVLRARETIACEGSVVDHVQKQLSQISPKMYWKTEITWSWNQIHLIFSAYDCSNPPTPT